MYKEKLISYGFKPKEADIYLACVSAQGVSAQDIADKIGTSRQVVYDHISLMLEQGLLSTYTNGKVRLFKAAPPSVLVSIADEKRILAKDLESDLKEYFLQENTITQATVFRGLQGLKHLLKMILESKEEVLMQTNYVSAKKLFADHEFYNFTLKRIEKKIILRIIVGEEHVQEPKIWKTDAKSYRYTRKNPIMTDSELTIIMFENKTIFMNMNYTSPQGILLVDEQLANHQKKTFSYMWEKGVGL